MSIGETVRQINLKIIRPTESVSGAEVKIAEIKRVMEKYGRLDDAAVAIEDKTDETIYLPDGRHRLAAARRELGITKIPVVIVEFSELPKFYLYYNSVEDIRRAASDLEKSR